jgi:RND superfamily putative drug exporter
MRKLAAWCHDRLRTVIGLWVAAFFISAGLWATAAGEFVNNFNLPGTESQRAYDLLKEKFPAQSGDTASVVFAVEDGSVLDKRAEIEAVREEIAKSPEVLAVGDPLAQGAPVSEDGRTTFAQIQLRKGGGDADPAAIKTMAEDIPTTPSAPSSHTCRLQGASRSRLRTAIRTSATWITTTSWCAARGLWSATLTAA